MNRLVLIGNGYDLAAGLPTSYEDFLVDYFKNIIHNCIEKNTVYSDEFINLYHNIGSANWKILDDVSTIDEIHKHERLYFSNSVSTPKGIEGYFSKNINKVYIELKSVFFRHMLQFENWKDIEGFYFEKLLEIHNSGGNINLTPTDFQERKIAKLKRIKALNRELDNFKIKLAEYIKGISDGLSTANIKEPLCKKTAITKEINEEDFKKFFNKNDVKKTKKELNHVLIVNFNYTPTIAIQSMIDSEEDQGKYSGIPIHGDCHTPGDIIFGYGDDTHPSYSDIEHSNENEYLKNMKSFYYPLNENYITLMNFLEEDQFEVQILGHSLGLSDRVLLKSIFENKNCRCIRIFHRGRDDEKKRMPEKYMALSRHFDNKMIMREKIVPFKEEDCITSK